MVTAQQFIQAVRQDVWRGRFEDDLLDQFDLVMQVVPVQFDEVPLGGLRHQDAHADQYRRRHQRVERGQPRGEGEAPQHQRAPSGASST